MKKILTIVLAIMLILVATFSTGCSTKGDGGATDGGGAGDAGAGDGSGTGGTGTGNGGNTVYDPNKSNLIFNEAIEQLVVIYGGQDLSADLRMQLNDVLYSAIGRKFRYKNETPTEVAQHEIIIGKSSRAVSVKAYEMLDRLMDGEDESKGGYVVYSDGSSIAAAYTEEYTEHIKEFLFEYLVELCDTDELVAPRGVLMQECINLYEIYEAEDAEWRAQEWAAFEAEMGPEITAAFKYLYNMYSADVIEWLANLYEPRVCVCDNYDENGIRICLFPKDENGNYICKNGGFYYSNSGRNTYGYGIDIESTIQALGIIERAGLTREFGGNYVEALPPQIRADIVAFLKSCQDPNGFFYHPQWSHEDTDAHLGRRGRDLMWAESLLQKFGAKPFYNTPSGTVGEGAPGAIVSPTALTGRLGASSIIAASRVVSVSTSVADHLVSAETFKAYLDTLPINTLSYHVGNQLAAQSTQLVARDKQLNGAIKKVLFDWCNAHQNPQNGLWEPQINHSSVNGLFKILTFYNDFKEPFPYAYEAACAAIQVISSDEVPAHVCSIYNAWWDVGALLKNMELYNTSYSKEQREEIRKSVLSIAAQGLYDTRDWYEVFLKNSGSFSYTPNYASSTSQGMPVALPKTAEGDVNATEICLNGLRNHAAYALGVSVTPDLFGTLEMVKFLHIIENANPSIKDEVPEADPLDFEYDDIGIKPELVSGNLADAESGLLMSGGYALVSYAPDDRAGKVLHITHLKNPGKGDDLRIANVGNTRNTTCTILDTDMYVASSGTSLGASVAQFTLGKAYMFYMQTTADGRINLWEGSAFAIGKSQDRLLTVLDMDEWFNLRIEYYPGTKDTVRIKFYVNDELLIVSENYMDETGTKFATGSPEPVDLGEYFRFIGHSSYDMNLYLDNLYIGCENKNYKSEADTEGLVVNADKTGGERVTYTFDENTLPEDITLDGTSGKITVDGGAIKLNDVSGTSTLTIPVNVREGIGNVYSFGFDMQLTAAPKAGDTITVIFNVPYAQYGVKSFMEITFKVMQVDGRLALVPTNNGGKEAFASAAIFVGGDKVSIDLALFKDATTALIYADGVYVGSTEYFKITSTYKPYHYDFSSVSFIYKGGIEATLDNVYAEIRLGNFAEETKPTCDRVTHTFDSITDTGFETDGAVANGVLTLTGGKFFKLPLIERANFISAETLNATINARSLTQGKSVIIKLEDADGNVIFQVNLVKNGSAIDVYEVASHGVLSTPVATFTAEDVLNITLDYYTVNDIVTLTVNEKTVLSTTIFVMGTPCGSAFATVISDGITLDNVYFEGTNATYRAPTLSTENLDSASKVITYEHSSTGNLPSRLTTSLKTGGGKAAIELMERNGEIGKVLNLTTSAGDADQVNFNLSADGKTAANKLVFETDVMFALDVEKDGVANYSFEIFFLGKNNETASKNVLSQRSTGLVAMQDYSNNSGAIVGTSQIIGNAHEWLKLRIEIDMGDGTKDTLIYRTYVNNVLVYESNNYWKCETGNPCAITEIAKIRFSTYNKAAGSIYFDNTSIYAVDSFPVVE